MKKILAQAIGALLVSGCSTATRPIPVPVAYQVTHSGRYVDISDTDVKPTALHMERPNYPFAFRRASIDGFALVEFIVNTSGTPTQVQVVNASDVAFAMSAVEAVKLWRFTAAQKNGVLVPCREQIPITFTVTND
jgi:TonB family protein